MLDRIQQAAGQWLSPIQRQPSQPTPGEAEKDQFTPGEPRDGLLEVGRKSLIIGAGLTLAGVPLPVSAGVAAVHLVSEAAPETTAKILTSTAAVAAGTVALTASLAAPVADVAGTMVRHAMGHSFLPGFSE